MGISREKAPSGAKDRKSSAGLVRMARPRNLPSRPARLRRPVDRGVARKPGIEHR